MLSKNRIKFIHSLEQKKFRDETALFVAEGGKLVGDLLKEGMSCDALYATPAWLGEHSPLSHPVTQVSNEELEKASFLRAPQGILGVFHKPHDTFSMDKISSSLSLALDNIQDPGNLGTILRIADWFGIEDIFLSPDSADAYGTKAIQATMGAIARVHIHYLPLPTLFSSLPVGYPVYGTFLHGDSIYTQPLSSHGLIVMGNEGNGIGAETEKAVTQRLFIPGFPQGREGSESLNVATATAIVCSEFRRREA